MTTLLDSITAADAIARQHETPAETAAVNDAARAAIAAHWNVTPTVVRTPDVATRQQVLAEFLGIA